MSIEVGVIAKRIKYSVVSVEKTDAPQGMPAGTWYRYIIGQGSSRIEGLKPGTLKSVTQHAETVAEDLNLRGKGGGAGYASKQKKR